MVFKNKDVIICDFDGTLVDSIGIWDLVDRKLISVHGKEPHENIGKERTKFLSEHTGGDIYDKYCSYLLSTYGIQGYTSQQLSNIRNKVSWNYQTYDIDYKEGAPEFLHKAKELGYKLVLVTSSPKKAMDIYINDNENIKSKANIIETFDTIITADDVTHKKPNPETYEKAVRTLNFPKSRVIAIEDELVGVESAITAGIEVISMYDKYSDKDRDFINKLATFSFNDFPSLTMRLK